MNTLTVPFVPVPCGSTWFLLFTQDYLYEYSYDRTSLILLLLEIFPGDINWKGAKGAIPDPSSNHGHSWTQKYKNTFLENLFT